MNEIDQHLDAIRAKCAASFDNANRLLNEHQAARNAAEHERDDIRRRYAQLRENSTEGDGSGLLALMAGFLFGGGAGFVIRWAVFG